MVGLCFRCCSRGNSLYKANRTHFLWGGLQAARALAILSFTVHTADVVYRGIPDRGERVSIMEDAGGEVQSVASYYVQSYVWEYFWVGYWLYLLGIVTASVAIHYLWRTRSEHRARAEARGGGADALDTGASTLALYGVLALVLGALGVFVAMNQALVPQEALDPAGVYSDAGNARQDHFWDTNIVSTNGGAHANGVCKGNPEETCTVGNIPDTCWLAGNGDCIGNELLGLEPPGNRPAGIFHVWQTYYSYYLGAGIKRGKTIEECVGLGAANRTHLTTVTLPKDTAAARGGGVKERHQAIYGNPDCFLSLGPPYFAAGCLLVAWCFQVITFVASVCQCCKCPRACARCWGGDWRASCSRSRAPLCVARIACLLWFVGLVTYFAWADHAARNYEGNPFVVQGANYENTREVYHELACSNTGDGPADLKEVLCGHGRHEVSSTWWSHCEAYEQFGTGGKGNAPRGLTCVNLAIDVEPMSRARLIGTGWYYSLCATVFAFMFALQYSWGKEKVGGLFSAQTGWYTSYAYALPGMPSRPGMPAFSCNCCADEAGYIIPEKEIGGRLGSLAPAGQPRVPEGAGADQAFHSTFLAHLSNYRPIKGGDHPTPP